MNQNFADIFAVSSPRCFISMSTSRFSFFLKELRQKQFELKPSMLRRRLSFLQAQFMTPVNNYKLQSFFFVSLIHDLKEMQPCEFIKMLCLGFSSAPAAMSVAAHARWATRGGVNGEAGDIAAW